jgi:hypothetical protein
MLLKNRTAPSVTFVAPILALLLLATGPCRAQTGSTTNQAYVVGTDEDSIPGSSATNPGQPAVADPVPSPAGPTSVDSSWHLAVSPYLWFPGVHGTIASPAGRSLGFRASPGDLLSHFRFGLMGAVEARRKRIVVPIDLMWIRLGADNAVAAPGLGVVTSANMTATELIFTPKIGYRVIDEKGFKADVLSGIRFWHFGENLHFNPSLLGLNFNGSQNFVDPLVGGRIQAALSPKIVVNALGDVGGWGAGSQLEYQIAGLLGYRVKPALVLQVGYRYLNIDYRRTRGVVFNVTTAGVIFGATLTLK